MSLKLTLRIAPSSSVAQTTRDGSLEATTKLKARSDLAFTYLRLGDLAMESDKFAESLEEFQRCLEIR